MRNDITFFGKGGRKMQHIDNVPVTVLIDFLGAGKRLENCKAC